MGALFDDDDLFLCCVPQENVTVDRLKGPTLQKRPVLALGLV